MRDELTFEARELFRASRDALGPSEFDLARVRRRVRIAVAGGTGAAVLAKTTAASANSHALAVTCAIGATLAGGGVALWTVMRPSASPPPPSVIVPAPVVAPELAPSPEPPTVVLEAPPPPAPVRVMAPAIVSATPPADSLATELAILRSADEALHHAEPARSLAIIRSAHPTQLAAELAALEIDALCALSRSDQARERTEAFLVRWPKSALRDRVTHSCGGHR